jgi:hypothetical protein
MEAPKGDDHRILKEAPSVLAGKSVHSHKSSHNNSVERGGKKLLDNLGSNSRASYGSRRSPPV